MTPKRRRRSVAMFVEAHPETLISALPGTTGRVLQERLGTLDETLDILLH